MARLEEAHWKPIGAFRNPDNVTKAQLRDQSWPTGKPLPAFPAPAKTQVAMEEDQEEATRDARGETFGPVSSPPPNQFQSTLDCAFCADFFYCSIGCWN